MIVCSYDEIEKSVSAVTEEGGFREIEGVQQKLAGNEKWGENIKREGISLLQQIFCK